MGLGVFPPALLLLIAGASHAASTPKSLPSAPKTPASPVAPLPSLPVPPAAALPAAGQVLPVLPQSRLDSQARASLATPVQQAERLGQAVEQARQEPSGDIESPLSGFFDQAEPASPGAEPVALDESEAVLFSFAFQEPMQQARSSGWYQRKTAVIPWGKATQPGYAWLAFYRDLYRGLVSEPKAALYHSKREGGPVFLMGGHDVAQALLGLPRSNAAIGVNLYGRYSNPGEMVSMWVNVHMPEGSPAPEIEVDPEPTASLEKMIEIRRKLQEAGTLSPDALATVQNNIFLKWNLAALSSEGLEIYPLDEKSAEDIAQRRLRLSLERGFLSDYELHYNLIVAYRAMRQAPEPWTLEPRTRWLLKESLLRLSQEERRYVAIAAASNPSIEQGEGPEAGAKRLLAFVRRELGEAAFAELEEAAKLAGEHAPPLLKPRLPARPSPKLAFIDALAAPWRTRAQLDRLASEPREPGETFRFAVLGDAEPGRFWFFRRLFNVPGVFSRFMTEIEGRGLDFTIQLGDLVSRGVSRNFKKLFEEMARLSPSRPFLTVIGNHDRHRPHGKSHSRLYERFFGRTDYFFDRAGHRFVVLDSSAGSLTQRQLDWLDSVLDTDLPGLVFTHMPPSVLADRLASLSLRLGTFRRGARRFHEIMARRGVRRVYSGHNHILLASEVDGVGYRVTGGGGSPLFPTFVGDLLHHYLTVEVGPEGVRETVHALDGRSFPLR